MLHRQDNERDSCGVGFITRKDGQQCHDVLAKGHEALCVIPHRGGMSSEGIGDGAGVLMDISLNFFSKVLLQPSLKLGEFGVGNFFFPIDHSHDGAAKALVDEQLAKHGLTLLHWRKVPINTAALNEASNRAQQPIHQVLFSKPAGVVDEAAFEKVINAALINIEAIGYGDDQLRGFYPISMSSRTMVYKGRLNSGEVVPYFKDLSDPEMQIRIFLFHTRFSTNTEPAVFMAQPFRRMAHNGELNTDKKNRLSEDAIAKQKNKKVIFPKGQSDSARLDSTLQRRIIEDEMDIVTAVLAMMPPAWENSTELSPAVRSMYEYFSLYEEKNDGPAALVFCDGIRVGARLDRLGLRPLRSVETEDYLCVMSEAGQIDFPPQEVSRRGRIEAGGMICFDHELGKTLTSSDIEERLAAEKDYATLLKERSLHIDELPEVGLEELRERDLLPVHQRHVAYGMNQESFRFLLDPMVESGAEKVSAMGYGVSLNVLNPDEGGMSKYFSQRFAQVTNPPLDSIREKDGMTLRVALGTKPNFSETDSRQIVLDSPVLQRTQLAKLRRQKEVSLTTLDILYSPSRNHQENEKQLEQALHALLDQVEAAAKERVGIIVLSDRNLDADRAALPLLLAIAASNQRLIEGGLRFNSSLVVESGQSASAHDIATALGFGASAICPLTVHDRAVAIMGEEVQKGLDHYSKAIDKSLMKTMGKFGLCTAESYIGAEIFEANYINTEDPKLKPHFPNIPSPVGGADYAAIAHSVATWHFRAIDIENEEEIPHLGLFKERQEGAGHSFGAVAVREYINMTEEEVTYSVDEELGDIFDRFEIEKDYPDAFDMIIDLKVRIGKSIHTDGELMSALGDIFVSTDLPIHQAAVRSVAAVLGRNLEHKTEIFHAEDYTSDIDEVLATIPRNDDPLGHISYQQFGYRQRTPQEIDRHKITHSYRQFAESIYTERKVRPAALRDIMYFPADINKAKSEDRFIAILKKQAIRGNNNYVIKGLKVQTEAQDRFTLSLVMDSPERRAWLQKYLSWRFADKITLSKCEQGLEVLCHDSELSCYFARIIQARESIELHQVQPAHQITATLSSAAMSHGALIAEAHEAVSQGANIAGALSNSGEGGEKRHRFDTIKASSIKQVASGRFGVWAGYFADPALEEVEIKIAQGAKPGEGGQLPSHKVSVVIASSRGGTPKIELVSPPPHHDTYSIEDLGQLIHDCKASRARVIVKLVSSEGIGTIAVGVAKAGADVINVAGNTGGTGAAAVTSLKNTGRSAELGIAEVHQALCVNGLREKVTLRASNAHQTGMDVIKSAVLGADSFEFGTTALMMLRCVMAKNCNVKCPAGITTNPELFQGDARALAQYFLNVAHEVRELLAYLGYESLREVRGNTKLLHLIHHDRIIGELNFTSLLSEVEEAVVPTPIYCEADYSIDDKILRLLERELLYGKKSKLVVDAFPELKLNNRNKSFGGQLSIDIERILNHRFTSVDEERCKAVMKLESGRRYLAPETVTIKTHGSAGQSYGAFLNNGMVLEHRGTCNDGVGKAQCGGRLIVRSPGGGTAQPGQNVLIGNFALFGATGGSLYVNGEAGDRFAVRNSGCLAVVEGVGDFCCEYMTSGAILNLGVFGKGFANGMSGGNVYQYDPSNKLEAMCDHQSITLGKFDADTDQSRAHEAIVIDMLRKHLQHTNSSTARFILDHWELERHHFWFAVPSALYETQTHDRLLENTPRKEMIDEIGMAYTKRQLDHIRAAYEQDVDLFSGEVPAIGESDTLLVLRLIIRYSIFAKASEIAIEKGRQFKSSLEPDALAKSIRNIILTEDRQLVDYLFKNAKEVLGTYDDVKLAKALADKRVHDYKIALMNRDVQENNSPGTMAWIINQNRANLEARDARSSFIKDCAAKISVGVIKSALSGERQLPLVPEKTPLSFNQMQWLSGYFNGLSFGLMTVDANDGEGGGKPILIAYGTQTGNAETLATECAELCDGHELSPEVVDMSNLTPEMIASTERLIIITSTYGEGEQPDNAQNIWKAMVGDGAPKLENLYFSICAIGDTNYDLFCQAGIDWDERLEALGAQRVHDMVKCDVDFEAPFEAWAAEALPAISAVGDQTVSAGKGTTKPKKEASLYGKKNPFPAKLKSKTVLTSPDSTKQVVHYEIDLEGSGFHYEVGDALQVIPSNDPALVSDVLEALGASGEEPVGDKNLRETLMHDMEIKTPSKEFLEAVSKQSGDEELQQLVLDDTKRSELSNYLWGKDVIDFLTDRAHGLDPTSFLALCKKMAPRAYSISSSINKHPNEVHLTVGSVRYESHGRQRSGVASTWLADRVEEDLTDIPCYLHHNKAFAVPEDNNAPMVMVGPGTGIAPFRAFLEEREIRSAQGKNWLFFGERNSATDSYYQDQLGAWLENGNLTKLSLAFSRDQKEKIYVQNRMVEHGAELFQWLEEGAYFFVCGDAFRMAKDVDRTLLEIVAQHGNMSEDEATAYIEAMKSQKRYVRDVY